MGSVPLSVRTVEREVAGLALGAVVLGGRTGAGLGLGDRRSLLLGELRPCVAAGLPALPLPEAFGRAVLCHHQRAVLLEHPSIP